LPNYPRPPSLSDGGRFFGRINIFRPAALPCLSSHGASLPLANKRHLLPASASKKRCRFSGDLRTFPLCRREGSNFDVGRSARLPCFALRATQGKHRIAMLGARRVEPNDQNGKETAAPDIAKKSDTVVPCPSPRCPGLAGEDVAKVVLAWAKLPESIRAAILTLVDAANSE
jgi:hypothetical protein